MHDVVMVMARRWRLAVALAAVAGALAGAQACSSGGGQRTAIDVTVDVDPARALDGVELTASTPGKTNLDRQLVAAATVRLTVAPSGLADGAVVTIESKGMKSGSPMVVDRARVDVRAGQRVSVTLHL